MSPRKWPLPLLGVLWAIRVHRVRAACGSPLFRGVCVAIRCPAVPLGRGAGSCLCLEPATATARNTELWSCGISCSPQPVHVHLHTHLCAGWGSGPLPVLGPTGPARRAHWDVRGRHVPRGPSTVVWGCCRQGPLVQTHGRGAVSCVAHPGGPECHGREATTSSQRLKSPTQHRAGI